MTIAPKTNAATDIPAPEVVAAIVAAVSRIFGPRARIAGMHPAPATAPSETFAQQLWSLEGRREIYHSHNPR